MENHKDTICILIPGRVDKPVGGHKVIYEYANRFAHDGYKVIVANCLFEPSNENFVKETLRRVHAVIRFVLRFICKQLSARNWFPLADSITEKKVWTFSHRYVPEADFYIASDATTTPYLLEYNPASRKIYFIQGYENWRMSEKQLRETYHFPFEKVVVSKWLSDIMFEENEKCTVVENGVDRSIFSLTIPIAEKDVFSISMLYHEAKMKNVSMGFEALSIVKKEYPALSVKLFGVYDRPEWLEDWYEYYQCPDPEIHNRINNECAIYIGTSSSEGWGLTVGEAMMCGQAVCCTDTRGYLEMAIDGETALVSAIGDAKSLASNIIRLIEDKELRLSIATKGMSYIQRFSVDESYQKFKQVLFDN